MFTCMSWTVYEHITPSGKRYIGITSKKPEKRWHNGRGYDKETPFGKAIEKYKWDNIQHNIISTDLTEKEAKWLENYLICYYCTFVGFKDCKGYNCTLGGDGSLGYVPTEEARKKISESNKGRTVWNKGKKGKQHHSEETKIKMSEAHKGQIAWNKGKPSHNKGKHLSEEQKKKISTSLKGKTSPNKGKPMSEDAKRKNSESHKGKHRVYHEDGTFHMER